MKNKKQGSVINHAWQKAREGKDLKLVLDAVSHHKALARSKNNKEYFPDGIHNKDRRAKPKGRKNRVKGERVIENYFLRKKQLAFWWEKGQTGVSVIGNAVPIGAINNERRQVDLLGLDQSNSPVAIEIKITDRNPWYAAVELCEYVCRLRHDKSGLEAEFMRRVNGKRYRGVWGILLAPLKWYFKDAEQFKKHRELIEVLQKKTKVRICSLAWVGEAPRNLILVAGRPPIKSYKTT